MHGFSVIVGSLVAAAEAHDEVADDLARAIAALRDSLRGRPWGGDEPGRRFGRAHRRNEEQVLRGLDQLVVIVESVGGGLRSNASTYDGAERASAVP